MIEDGMMSASRLLLRMQDESTSQRAILRDVRRLTRDA